MLQSREHIVSPAYGTLANSKRRGKLPSVSSLGSSCFQSVGRCHALEFVWVARATDDIRQAIARKQRNARWVAWKNWMQVETGRLVRRSSFVFVSKPQKTRQSRNKVGVRFCLVFGKSSAFILFHLCFVPMRLMPSLFWDMAVGQNQWYHLMNSPPSFSL